MAVPVQPPARLSRLSRRSPQEDDAERSAALRREGLLVVQVSSAVLGAGRAGTRRDFPQHLGLRVKVCGTTLVPERKCHLCPALSQLLPASLAVCWAIGVIDPAQGWPGGTARERTRVRSVPAACGRAEGPGVLHPSG